MEVYLVVLDEESVSGSLSSFPPSVVLDSHSHLWMKRFGNGLVITDSKEGFGSRLL